MCQEALHVRRSDNQVLIQHRGRVPLLNNSVGTNTSQVAQDKVLKVCTCTAIVISATGAMGSTPAMLCTAAQHTQKWICSPVRHGSTTWSSSSKFGAIQIQPVGLGNSASGRQIDTHPSSCSLSLSLTYSQNAQCADVHQTSLSLQRRTPAPTPPQAQAHIRNSCTPQHAC